MHLVRSLLLLILLPLSTLRAEWWWTDTYPWIWSSEDGWHFAATAQGEDAIALEAGGDNFKVLGSYRFQGGWWFVDSYPWLYAAEDNRWHWLTTSDGELYLLNPEGGLRNASAKPTSSTSNNVAAQEETAEWDLLQRLNNLRSAEGLGALRRTDDIDAFARSWSREMGAKGALVHSPSALRTPLFTGPARPDFGENVSLVDGVPLSPTAAASSIMNSWRTSPTHLGNMLTPGWREAGIGIHQDANGAWWATLVMMGDR